jgi:chromosome segregation ATPase
MYVLKTTVVQNEDGVVLSCNFQEEGCEPLRFEVCGRTYEEAYASLAKVVAKEKAKADKQAEAKARKDAVKKLKDRTDELQAEISRCQNQLCDIRNQLDKL